MRTIHQLLCFIFVVLFSACNLLSSDQDKEITLKLEPLQESYALDKGTNITIRVKNISSKTIYSSDCNYGLVEELEGSKVSNAMIFDNHCECICKFSIKPKEEKDLNVKAGSFLIHDEFLFTTDVKYKIRPYFYKDKELHELLSANTYKSAPIILTKK